MNRRHLLTHATLLSTTQTTLHVADDIVRGYEKGNLTNLFLIPLLVTWLYGALVLSERRVGLVISLVFSTLAVGIPMIHFSGPKGVAGGRVAGSEGATLFVWTLLALGVSAAFGAVLSAHALWRRPAPAAR
jgi:hypothetical protein